MGELKTLLAKARAEMGEERFQEFCNDLAGRPESWWWCEKCCVEVYDTRCPHCGKTKQEKP